MHAQMDGQPENTMPHLQALCLRDEWVEACGLFRRHCIQRLRREENNYMSADREGRQ